MGINDRFYLCESLGFPAVSNYDYETNLPVRSSNNRDFRWEEVAVSSIYHMKEATASGSFEDNTFVIDNSVTNATGINYITTGNQDTTSYLGWTVTGAYSIYIGMSGIRASSGDLSGQTSSFYAHPIVGNEAIGLYYTGGTEIPTLISVEMSTGLEGDIIIDNVHQVYLKAKTNYGTESGRIQAYLRGWAASNIVGYYDPASGSWQSSVPTEYFNVALSGYTTIKYNFTTSNFPAATPTTFDLCIASIGTGSFVTVDDIHVDALLKRNAFLDYIVPTGYMIQVTPDLGWHDMTSMFESSELQNPHLSNLGPFSPELANLEDNLDNTVTATIDLEVFKDSLSSNFKKYLWRALPITPNGQLGTAGLPQKFEYVGSIIDTLFSIKEIINKDSSAIQSIVGTRSTGMQVIVDGIANHPGLTYPTPTSWRLDISLSSSNRTVVIQGIDISGSTTSTRDVKLVNRVYEKNTQALWNVFDEHGLIADVERLPEESNYNYSLRIKDAYGSRSGPNFSGIVNGASRELNIKKLRNALQIEILKNENSIPTTQFIEIEVTAFSVRIHDSSFIINEKLLLDPVHNTVDLSYLPKEIPTIISSSEFGDMNSSNVSLSLFDSDDRINYRAKIKNTTSQFVELTYAYYEEFLFKDYPTLFDIISALNSITIHGKKLFNVSISSYLSGNESSLGLYVASITLDSRDKAELSWSPIQLKKMTEQGYKDYYLTTPENTLKNTEYYSYVKELKNNTKVFWGAIEADRDRWDAADSKDLGMESIPTLFDPPLSKLLTRKNGSELQIEPIMAWGKNYKGFSEETMQNQGLTSNFFQPGVAHTSHLLPSIYITSSFRNTQEDDEFNIGPIKNNNKVVLFSGQK